MTSCTSLVLTNKSASSTDQHYHHFTPALKIETKSLSQVQDHFDKDPATVSGSDYGLHNVHDLQNAIESDKQKEIQRQKEQKEKEAAKRAEADPSGSMKLKAELDAEAKKLGVETEN